MRVGQQGSRDRRQRKEGGQVQGRGSEISSSRNPPFLGIFRDPGLGTRQLWEAVREFLGCGQLQGRLHGCGVMCPGLWCVGSGSVAGDGGWGLLTHAILEGRHDLRSIPRHMQGVGVDVEDLPFLLFLPLQLQPTPLLGGQQPHRGGEVSLEGAWAGKWINPLPLSRPIARPSARPWAYSHIPALQSFSLCCENPGSLGSLEGNPEPLGFGDRAGRLTLGQSSPAYPARTEKEPMSKTSAPTSSVQGDRCVRGPLPNSASPPPRIAPRGGQGRAIVSPPSTLAGAGGRSAWSPGSWEWGSSLQSPFLPGGLIQATLLAGKEGAGWGGREEVSWMVKSEPSARKRPTCEDQGRSGAGPKPVRAPG